MSVPVRVAIRLAALLGALGLAPAPAVADDPPKGATAAPAAPAAAACPHGVRKSLCARCNPKLAPVYRANGDWCAEHDRPESQCVLCHPELAQKGVK